MSQAMTRANRASSRGVPVNGSTPAAPAPASERRSQSLLEPSADIEMGGMNGAIQPVTRAAETPRADLVPLHAIKQLPTPALEGIPPAQFASTPAANGRIPEISYVVPPLRSLFAESDNPIERKFRDPGKGKHFHPCTVAILLTVTRHRRRNTRFCGFHDTSQPSKRPEMEAHSLRVGQQNPAILLYLSTKRPQPHARHPQSDLRAPFPQEPQSLCHVELEQFAYVYFHAWSI